MKKGYLQVIFKNGQDIAEPKRKGVLFSWMKYRVVELVKDRQQNPGENQDFLSIIIIS